MEPVVVLGVDAADYDLARQWNCENLLLDYDAPLKTNSYSVKVPVTLEIWPTIATGLSPDQHGVILNNQGWNSHPVLNVVVDIANRFPEPVTERLRLAKEIVIDAGSGTPQTDAPHIFDHDQVLNWPGITPSHKWVQEGKWFNELNDGALSVNEFYTNSLWNAGKILVWVVAMAHRSPPIIGAHIHTLDHMGHIYADRPGCLREVYQQVDSLVGMVAERVDRLVVLSDHGMQTAAVESDSDPGVHSFRALVSSSFTDDLPESALAVSSWLEGHIDASADVSTNDSVAVDAPEEHLRDLGYL